MELDIEEIKEILPHRFPFLMIDKVTSITKEKLIAIKNVSANEQFFQGHFPNLKVMPGVLIIEAMAQAAIVFFYHAKNKKKDALYYLGKVKAKFFRPVTPGDQLEIEVTPLKLFSDKGIVHALARVNSEKAAECQIAFSVKG